MTLIGAQVKGAIQRAADFLVPPTCPLCQDIVARPGGLCAACWAELPVLSGRPCVSCGLPPLSGGDGGDKMPCDCEHLPQLYDQRRAVMRYEGAARTLILRFKHADRTDCAPDLARLMMTGLRGLERECDLIVPVPIHWRRYLGRRYNQSALLADHLGAQAGVPVGQGLVRTRPTPPQSGGRGKRTKNVRDAFALDMDVTGKRVLLVDDVMTTGATLGACAALLKDAGAAAVHYAVLAAVPPARKGVGKQRANLRP